MVLLAYVVMHLTSLAQRWSPVIESISCSDARLSNSRQSLRYVSKPAVVT
jgi:hypothetical protein